MVDNRNPLLQGTKEEVIGSHLGLVHHICKRYIKRIYKFPALMEYDDLVSIGCIGLVKAYIDYADTQYTFSSYAGLKINEELATHFRFFSPGVKFSKQARENCIKMLDMELDREPVEVISQKLGITGDAARLALDYKNIGLHNDSLDYIKSEDENPDSTLYNQLSKTEDFDTKIILNEFLSTLTNKEKDMVILRFLYGMKQNEISRILEVPEKTVSTSLLKILKNARTYQGLPEEEPKKFNAPIHNHELILKMCRETDLSYAKIGDIVGCSRQTVHNVGKTERDKRKERKKQDRDLTNRAVVS